MNGMRLAGRKALITGASRGIGRAVALTFAEHGADVAIAARSTDVLATLADEIEAKGRKVHRMAWDLADVGQAAARLSEARDALGGLDTLVNNAGVVRLPKDHPAPGPEAAWDFIMDINLKALYFLSEAAGAMMQEQGGGVIVNLASDAGQRGAPNAYGISKWGVIGYTKGLAKRLAPAGVRVNGVAPGPVATQMMGCEDGNPKEAPALPLGRFALPEEVADVVLFLATDEARGVFGHTISVNTGNS